MTKIDRQKQIKISKNISILAMFSNKYCRYTFIKQKMKRRSTMYREYPKFKPEEVLVYLRKSRADDDNLTVEEVLERHENDIRQWADRNLDTPIPKDNWYREVVSGESIQSREEFKKLLKRIESKSITAVVVKDCARLGRPSLEEIGKIANLFRYSSTYIISVMPYKVFDLSDKWDRQQFESEMMRNRDYLDYIKGILRSGKENSQRSGWYINGVVPYGYEREWVIDGKRERPTLAIVEDEAKIVRMIFDWYVNDGIGTAKICQKLNAMGVPARKGNLWKKSSISNILKNEHYMGKVVIRKHIDVKTVEDFEITTHCVKNKDYEIVDGQHPAIIDEETFYKANKKIHRYPSVKPSDTLQNPLASVLKCSCGRTMVRRKNRNTFRYLCDDQMFCGSPSISETELIPAIIQALQEHLDDLSSKVSDDSETKKRKHTEYVSSLEQRYVEIEKKELSLWDKYAEEKMPKQVFDKLLQKCLEEKQSLDNALKQAYADEPQAIDYNSAIATLHETIKAFENDSVSASVKNKLLLSAVDRITYHRDKPIPTKENEQPIGYEQRGSWYVPPFTLDVKLKV